jgi:molybdenum cofactor sulfurtransferase
MPQQRANGSPLVRNPRAGFANEQPILLISENAVAALNQVLEEQNQKLVGSRHFRPNLVVKSIGEDGCHIEDEWKTLRLAPNATLIFEAKGSCARCTMIDYDPMTGKKGKTLRALAKYRRRNGQITFGIFLQAVAEDSENKEIWIEEGDELLCT